MARPTRLALAATVAAAVLSGVPVGAQMHDMSMPASFDEPMPLHHDGRGLGPFTRPVTTASAEAQAYFDQGIQLLYAFDATGAARSFHEASKLDPNCAMCWFGEAWAWGPYLNGPLTSVNATRAYHAMQRALATMDGNTTPVERALIEAMAVRYEPEHVAERRRGLDERWAAAAGDVYRRFPHDLEAGFLAGESLMLLQPRRGLWDIHNPEVQEIHRVLESVLDQDLTHPGACHLYIHATEPTQEPGKAAPCAELLGASIPGASHIQHMPSHTWNRIGRWGDAVRANIDAWHSDLKAARGMGFAIYPSHNLHMLLFAASNDGQGAIAIQAGKDYGKLMDGGAFYHALTLVRFGRFDEVLELTGPAPSHPIFGGLWTFSRGYAHLRLGEEGAARAALAEVRQAIVDAPDGTNFRGHTAAQLLGVVAAILEGELLRADGDLDGAIRVMAAGVTLEDTLEYDEPEPLNFSIRHWLGNALLEAGRYEEAVRVFETELEKHPNNGWSLFGLEAALRALGHEAEAERVHQDFLEAWARSDTYIVAPIF